MATPTSRPRVALSALLLLGLPACANPMRFAHTEAQWCDEEVPVLEWNEQVADLGVAIAPDPEWAGALSVQAQRVDDEPMPVFSGLVGPRSRWQLTPEHDAAEAMSMLTAAEGFTVHRATIELQRDYLEGDIVRSDAYVRLDVGVDWTVVGTRVDEAALPPATRHAKHCARRNDLSESSEPRLLPDLLTQCADRLADLDLSPLLPDAGYVGLESWVWVDRAGNVVDPKQAEALTGAGLDDPKLPLAQRLERLAALRLLVVVVTGTSRATFLLRPDCVWLCGGMETDLGRTVHRSRWHARPVVTSPEVAAALSRSLASGTMRLHMWTGHYDYDPVLDFASRVLATPFTVALDVLEWMVGREFLQWLLGEQLVEDPKPKQRRDWR